MTQRVTFTKLVIAVFALALAITGTSALVATEVQVEPLTQGCAIQTANLDADQLTFPVTPWFAESANIFNEPLGIGCIPDASCTADWQCGGGNRGYCKAVPGHCVCL